MDSNKKGKSMGILEKQKVPIYFGLAGLVMIFLASFFGRREIRLDSSREISFQGRKFLKAVEKVENSACGLAFSNIGTSVSSDVHAEVQRALKGLKKPELVKALLAVQYPGVVVDVGASAGELLTFPALDARRVVYSVEPDKRTVSKILEKAHQRGIMDSRLKVVAEAAGIKERYMNMQFHKTTSQLSCVHCTSENSTEIYHELVEMLPIDRLVHEPVFLYKISARGYEGDILGGSRELFDDFGVRYVVLTFSPKLMENYGNFEGIELDWVDYNKPEVVLAFLLDRNYHCFDMTWTGSKPGSTQFSEPISRTTMSRFTSSVLSAAAEVELFCMKCAS
mmetsp:Transcript_30372/g.116447  ORF Transcript_30372/g.116447 Transcript_30372/m.116447 type:complete len:337 (-) Transcript_30372:2886-3896(-)